MNSKRHMILLPLTALIVLAAITLITAVGCDMLEGITPRQRVDAFMRDINQQDRSGMRTAHIHPNVDTQIAADFWGIHFPEEEAGSFALSDIEENGNTITATFSSATEYSGTVPIEFRMSDSLGNAQIRTLILDGNTIIQ